MQAYIGRIVVLLAPLIAALSLFIVNLVQDLVGVELDGTELTALLTAAVVGAFGVIYKWLDNRGKWEVEVANFDAREFPEETKPKKK